MHGLYAWQDTVSMIEKINSLAINLLLYKDYYIYMLAIIMPDVMMELYQGALNRILTF